MKIIFLLPAGAIEWPVPEDQRAAFNFIATVQSVRAAGCFMSGDLYIRHDQMVGMSWVPADGEGVKIVRKDMH